MGDRRISFQYPSHDDKGKPCRRTYSVRVEDLSVKPPEPLGPDATDEQREAHEKASGEYEAAAHEHRARSHRAHLDVATMRRHKGGGAIVEEDVGDPPPAPTAPGDSASDEEHAAHAVALKAHGDALAALEAARKADCATFAAPTAAEHKQAALVDFARHAMGSDENGRKLWEEHLRGLRREAMAKKAAQDKNAAN